MNELSKNNKNCKDIIIILYDNSNISLFLKEKDNIISENNIDQSYSYDWYPDPDSNHIHIEEFNDDDEFIKNNTFFDQTKQKILDILKNFDLKQKITSFLNNDMFNNDQKAIKIVKMIKFIYKYRSKYDVL